MSKRIEIADGVSVSPEVKTSITMEEYNKCIDKIPDNVTIVENTEKGLITLVQTFSDVKKVIMDGFNALDESTLRTLALREYKTRDFQDNARQELRNVIGLSTSISSGMRELQKALKNDPDKLAKLLKEYGIK